MKWPLLILALMISSWLRAQAPVVKFGSLGIGDVAPTFKAVGADGKPVSLADFKDKPVLVAFCGASGPRDALLKLHDEFKDQGLVLLVVFSGAPRASFDSWVGKNTPAAGLTAVWDPAPRTAPESIASGKFGISVIPSTGVIDRDGKIVGGFSGFGSQSAMFASALLVSAGLKAPTAPTPTAGAGNAGPPPLEIGVAAPDFATIDAGGKTVKLSDYAGKIVVLDFWATWCGPCIASMPHTEKIAAQTKAQDVVVLASCTSDLRASFDAWLGKNRAQYPSLVFSHDPAGRGAERASSKLYRVRGIPTQFVIGRDGKIAAINVGYGEGDRRLEEALKALGVKF